MAGALLAPILALLLAMGPGVLAERAAHWPEWRLPAPLDRPSARAGHQDLSYPDWMAGRWQVRSDTRLTLGLRNLLDARYAEAVGFPAPGRTLFLSVQLEI